MRLERRTIRNGSSRRIPVFIRETHNQINYKCLPKFVQTDNAPLVEKRHMFDTSEIREYIRVQLVILLQRKLLEKLNMLLLPEKF